MSDPSGALLGTGGKPGRGPCRHCLAVGWTLHHEERSKEAFIISEIPAFTWPAASGPTFTKTDILNKNAPRCASSTQRP
ncbi:MAG: hypothetical protein IPI05_09970 [Flavobacteriales bacterium]|nr:hypothetical protein [Flavobacteriales bacterium]